MTPMIIMRNSDLYPNNLDDDFCWYLYQFLSHRDLTSIRIFDPSSNTWDLFKSELNLGIYFLN